MAAPSTGRRRPARRRGALLGSPKAARKGVDGRIRLLRFAFLVFLLLVGGKAVALASSSQHLTQIALDQQTVEHVLPAHRGSILDRNGDELAVGKPAQTVYATPYLLSDPGAAADELCEALQIRRKRKRRAIEKFLSDKESGFAYVARKVDPDLAKAAVDLGLPGVGSYAEEERTYPLKGTAAQVIGFAGTDNQGLAGVELMYDKELSGEAGSETVVRDPAGHSIRTVAHKEPESGENVRLTLDREIQYYAEDVLEKTVRGTGAKAATGIVMDPRTGEILVMANVTREGFHGFGKDPQAEKNRAVTDVYEPGSIFKLVTISGALADGLVTPDTAFDLPPSIWVADREINESHPRGAVRYSVKEILQWSSNVGAVKIGMLMEKHGLSKWVDAYGFGKPTGIDFPGESGGIVLPVEEWSGSSIGNIPMGQGIAVTAIQMASAFSAVANRRRAGRAASGGPGGHHRARRRRRAPGDLRQGGAPGPQDAADRGGQGHGHQGAHPGLRGRRQDGDGRDRAAGRRRLCQGRLRRLLRRHGAGRSPAPRGAGGGQRDRHVRRRRRRAGGPEDHALLPPAPGDRAVTAAAAPRGGRAAGLLESAPMKLSELLQGVPGATVRGDPGTEIRGLAYHTRDVADGTLFFCVPGLTVDGHEFAAAAVEAGAAAVVCERDTGVDAPQVVVPSVRRAMALAASAWYGHPTRELRVAGVTGTNGKTTTAHLIAGLFAAAGHPCGLLGTVVNRIGGVDHPVKLTTAESLDLQRMLRRDAPSRGRGVRARGQLARPGSGPRRRASTSTRSSSATSRATTSTTTRTSRTTSRPSGVSSCRTRRATAAPSPS